MNIVREVAKELRIEAELSARPGQMDRLLKLADMLDESVDSVPMDEEERAEIEANIPDVGDQ